MNTVLKISTVLTWIILVVFGFIVFLGILAGLVSGNMLLLIGSFLMASAILHSYACLKLHRSIRRSNVPLGDHTPVGIRFIGFVVLFFGICNVGNSIGILQNTGEIIKMMQPYWQGPKISMADQTSLLRGLAIFSLFLGLCMCVNVFLNFRLLRWYYLVKQSDIS